MSEFIKTGDEIWSNVEYSGADFIPGEKKWVSVSWLRKKIEEELNNFPVDTSSNCIENMSAHDALKSVLSLLE